MLNFDLSIGCYIYDISRYKDLIILGDYLH